jgi:hypothetical protein
MVYFYNFNNYYKYNRSNDINIIRNDYKDRPLNQKKKNSGKKLSLLEIARDFGISYQTLNYYTSLGLIHPERRQGNKRLYCAKDVKQRLTTIDRLKNEGYPLRIICGIVNGHKMVV